MRTLSFLAPCLLSLLAVLPRTVMADEAPKIVITPHRATYDMALGSIKNGSGVAQVSGKMKFEWADSCDGWAIQQQMQLHIVYSQGDESDSTSTIITWEAKDGSRYNFNVRRVTDGKETENFRGRATLSDQGLVSTTYAIPKGKQIKSPPNTVFPSTHTTLILQKALAGEKLFSRPVFDGSDEAGLSDVSVFINTPSDTAQTSDMPPPLRKNPLLATTAWPIRMAYFKPDSQASEPDYEMNLSLLKNGIAKFMQIDYSDFSVTGTLSTLEPLPASGC